MEQRGLYKKALNKVASYCSKAERCRFDVLRRLEKFDLPISNKLDILSWLEKENFLSEERFCLAFVNDKVKFSRWGRLKIQQGLRQKKIDAILIDQALSDMDKEVYLKNLIELIEKKKKSLGSEVNYEMKKKIVRYALNRGFIYSEIEWAFNDCGLSFDFTI